jgi:hypothetical protein
MSRRRPAKRREKKRQTRVPRAAALGVLVFALSTALYWPARHYDFVWDDALNLGENRELRLGNHAFFWTNTYQRLYVPVAYSAWTLLAQSTGDGGESVPLRPEPFRIANILLHALNATLVFLLVRRLTEAVWPAFAGALLFAAHPIQVEPVVWITEFRGLLAASLTLGALHLWLRFRQTRRILAAAGASLCGAAAVLSKPTAIVIPLIVLVIELLWRPVDRRRLAYAIAGTLASIPILWITKSAQPDAAVHMTTALWTRPLVAGDAVSYYLYKLVVPIDLAISYGRTPVAVLQNWLTYVLWVVPLALMGLAWYLRRRVPVVSFAIALVLLALAPVSGLVPFGFQNYSTVADRYFYLPMVGVALIAAWTIAQIPSRRWAGFGTAAIVVALVFLNVGQQPVWSSDLTLWRHAVDVSPGSAEAQFGFGSALAAAGDDRDAVAHYQRSISIRPSDPDVFFNLGNAERRLDDPAGAIAAYREAARLDPRHIGSRANLLLMLLQAGEESEARRVAAELQQLAPHHPVFDAIRRRGG